MNSFLENFSFYSIIKWLLICIIIGIFSGSTSAVFLLTLNWVTQYRETNSFLIWLLPICGFFIGLLYFYFGKNVVKGNNLILEEYENPQKTIPIIMAPLVFLGTILTHLFGGSAGREGTAVQMSSSIADQITTLFNLNNSDRKIILLLGISAGFSSVFGTPFAGAIFALEVLFFSKINLKSCVTSFIVAFIAYFVVEFWNVHHTVYSIPFVPKINYLNFVLIITTGILFGLSAMLFSKTTYFWKKLFTKFISYPPFRPFIGGCMVVLCVICIGSSKYIGLGIPIISEAFHVKSESYDFLLKILLTGITLGSGFKGGEVTPLFFIGATLGSVLSLFIPLPTALLAGMGFVAVFSGATHTPFACTIMGMELFGIETGIFIGMACLIAYFSSGSVGIYQAQIVKGPKYLFYQKMKRKDIEML